MKLKTFFDNFELLADAPDGVQKLREMILQLAVQGKLVPQDPKDEPASVLLEKIKAEKERLIKKGKIRKTNPLPAIQPGEISYELPEGWEWTRLGFIGYTQTGTTPSKSNPAYSGNYIPFIKPGDIFDNKINYGNEGLSKKGLEKGRLIDSNSILMVCIGGSIGKVNFIDRPCSCNQQINTITPYGQISHKLLNYFMRSIYFQAEVINRAPKTTLPIISKGKWELIPVPLPPTNEQKRVVAKVDELMALCDELEARKQKAATNCIRLNDASLDGLFPATESNKFNKQWQRICDSFDILYGKPENVVKLRQAILQLAVQGLLSAKWRKSNKLNPSGNIFERYKSRPGNKKTRRGVPDNVSMPNFVKEYEMPETWICASVAELLKIGIYIDLKDGNHGSNHPKKSEFSEIGVPFITAAQVNNLRIDYNGAYKLSGEALERIHVGFAEKGDVIYTHKGSIGRVAINERSCILSPQTTYCRVDHAVILNKYLMWYLLSPQFKNQVDKVKSQTTRDFVSITQQYLFYHIIPPLEEQKYIVAVVDELMILCDELETGLSESQTKCNTLMEAAMAEIMVA